ncbi:tetratricopeptide repeat protein [Phenylobacterium conjunctum]|uniref:Sel1 repeat family protein n=1 Tax=Phenylobacterium conjunctum TaxID=1298959 RepID=A0ABW3SYL5_9CAUL
MKRWGLGIAAAALLAAGSAQAQALTLEPWTAADTQKGDVEAAANGDLRAIIAVARRFERGEGVARDPAQAADYWAAAQQRGAAEGAEALRRLAEAGVPIAQYYYGRRLAAAGDDPAEALQWLRLAGDAGVARANLTLATLLTATPATRREAALRLARAGVQDPQLRTLTEVLVRQLPGAPRTVTLTPDGPWPLRARTRITDEELKSSLGRWALDPRQYYASSSQDRARIADGRLFEVMEGAVTGDSVAQSLAFRWLERACMGSTRLDLRACGAFADVGLRFRDSPSSATYYWTGQPRSLDVGHAYELGIGTPVDLRKALIFYSGAIDGAGGKVSAEAEYRLSRMFEAGQGGSRNPALAREYLIRAARDGHVAASYSLALQRLKAPPRTPGDWSDVAENLRVAADGGVPDAAYRLALLIRDNNKVGVRRPNEDLGRYYRMAAEAGNVHAVVGMGLAYRAGWGVPVDYQEASRWFERAAKAGDAEGAWLAGASYLERGDPAGAIPWMRRAAQAGHPKAQAKLNEIMAAGYRERNLAGFLASTFDLLGDVAMATLEDMAEAQAEYQRQLDAEIRRSMMVTAAIAEKGGSGGSSGSSAASGGDSGAGLGADGGGGAGAASGEGSSGVASAGGYGTPAGDAGAGDGGGAQASSFGGDSSGAGGSDGGYANASGGDLQSADGSSASGAGGSGESAHLAITVKDDSEYRAFLAEQERMIQEAYARDDRARADAAAANATAQAQAAADAEAAAAAARAKIPAACMIPPDQRNYSCVSPQ